MFGNIGTGEIIIILVIILVFFGAKKIPELASGAKKAAWFHISLRRARAPSISSNDKYLDDKK